MIALLAIFLGGFLGLYFRRCEDSIKGQWETSANDVLEEKYKGKPELAKTDSTFYWKPVFIAKLDPHENRKAQSEYAYELRR